MDKYTRSFSAKMKGASLLHCFNRAPFSPIASARLTSIAVLLVTLLLLATASQCFFSKPRRHLEPTPPLSTLFSTKMVAHLNNSSIHPPKHMVRDNPSNHRAARPFILQPAHPLPHVSNGRVPSRVWRRPLLLGRKRHTSGMQARSNSHPNGAYHCFENPSTTGEDLVVDFRLDKQDWEMEERFFRNFFRVFGRLSQSETESKSFPNVQIS
jgi:hypothetical protein